MSENGRNKKRFIEILKIIFVIPVSIVLLLSLIAFPSVLYVLYNHNIKQYIELLIYILSAYTFTVLCIRTPFMYRRSKEIIKGDSIYVIFLIRKIMRKFKYSKMYLEDVEFRATVALYFGFFINTLYAISRFFGGYKNQSIWFLAIGVYYFIFGIIRFFLIKRFRNKENFENINESKIYSIKTYRISGVLMFLLNIAMAGMIAQMVIENAVIKNYNAKEIYYVALYTFYIVFVSVYNMVKFRKSKNEILSASKNLNFVGALMSLFTLQTAMLLTFDDSQVDIQKMNGITGAVVILVSIVVAINMILKANRELRCLKEELEVEI